MTLISNDAGRSQGLYRTVWRWHFYAGLAVLPLLAWMAVTGALYLYKPEIERLVYRDWLRVDGAAPALALDPMVARVAAATGARVVQVTRPAESDTAWRMALVFPDGTRRTAFVDPSHATVRGLTRPNGITQTLRDLHSLILTGPIGNALVEIAAGWAILLVLTGMWLWWPRRGAPALALRGSPRGRLFWRDLHASLGLLGGAIILFLAVTGMPWSGVWGKSVQGWVATHVLGRPRAPGPTPWEAAAAATRDAGRQGLPWSMQQAAAPEHGAHQAHDGTPGPAEPAHAAPTITPGRAAAIASAHGLEKGWTMTLPAAPGAPYLVSATIVRAQDARVLYLDASDGHVLQDARYAQFGPAARAIEWGVAVHQGQQYGEANRLTMLAGCIALLLLCLSAPVMWWKRHPVQGRIAAPPRADARSARTVALILLVGGAVFPLTGATMVVALLADRLVARRSAAPA